MDDDYQKAPGQEWAEANAAKGASSKKTKAAAGEKALEACRRLLSEIVEPEPAAMLPCEHDYQPSKVFAFTLECSVCHSLVEDPERPSPTTRDNLAPLDSYKDLTQ